ncbi:RNA polymerase recycling motor HelD [Lederbergia wuyishanensis]|uniref:DNA helicase-2/ATP-dependent DNA helicase PcrA n=1 Tax=Lederbergia wuyishanensis TaxID=1347903 RepID=A0ABU0D234_9BACI|nr:RNA polymerase recycling motor HelD [Lederbergia wuyishanensis]MCJ8007366.1 UvrD-helicase domain-containing protein [Lederbergia wuyishanensis]MDQ0342467.1 DNA helicase-2/ATP-dependent DNA helicase PcrA [Lederbergia wuyishanensis]
MSKEWENEQQRVEFIQDVIDQKVVQVHENMGGLKGGIIELRKTFWEDVTVNLDEPDDVIETFTSIKQQAELLAERERTHGHSYRLLNQMQRLKDSPFFGRIDFHEDGEKSAESIYIGIASLMDVNDEEFLIYDWRAPISSLYYDYSPGRAVYKTPSGEISGTMELKRQYIIKNGVLKGMFDTGVTIGDSLLQEVLGGNANTQMKSIVATIQREQNHIIRNEKSKILIVQGVAGSGKTSAALQRVAYLLYRYRNTLSSDNIMLFSPNPLFNSYVATVLPELGEENMEQTTYQQYLNTRLGGQFSVDDSFFQMEYTLTAMNEPDYDVKMNAIRYKAGLDFKDQIDRYVEELSNSGLIFKTISFRGGTIVSAQDISKYFYSLDRSISIPNRLKLTSDWLLKEIAKQEKLERTKEWVLNEAELLDKTDYLEAFQHMQKNQDEETFDDADRELQILAKSIVNKHFKRIRNAVKKNKFLNIKALYHKLFTLKEPFDWPDGWEEICEETIKNLNANIMSYEDTTPYLYLQDQLEGRKSNTLIRHLFIDEAQDYSPFQFEFLKQLFPHCKMTILGDVNQAIYAHTMDAPSLLNLEPEGTEKIVLRRSYRSTKQIVDFTKGLITGGEMIEPFNRDGEKPVLIEVDEDGELHGKIEECVHRLKDKGHETIAIICKTMKESQAAYEALKTSLPVRLMDKNANSYEKGIIILPAYLAKGIEFDAVIIYNASNEQYGREYERKLFYTACTRAMHELYLFTKGKRTFFMDQVSEETFKKS